MDRSVSDADIVTIIRPKSGWQLIDFKELKQYRDLFYFMVWREIKVLYAQTILGFSWAILQPLIQIIMFTIVFGKVAKISSDGLPKIIFKKENEELNQSMAIIENSEDIYRSRRIQYQMFNSSQDYNKKHLSFKGVIEIETCEQLSKV